MNKIILLIILIGAMMTSCANNTKKSETKSAENVAIVNTSTTKSYKSVKEGSFVSWRATHLGGLQPRFGKIYFKNATFLVNNEKLTNASNSINMSTLTVESFPKGAEEIGKLTGHLLSPDFFNIEKFPTSKFELTNIEGITGNFNSKITGNLTMLGITKSITFNANVNISDKEVSIRSDNFSIDRTDWGLTYNTEGTVGVPVDYLIANAIEFTINVTMTK